MSHGFKQFFSLFFILGITWGRVVTLIVFGGKIALHGAKYAKNKSKTSVTNVIEVTARYINDAYGQWMVENQGWVSVQ